MLFRSGDLFDAVLAGAILKGATLKEAAFQAHNFVAACLQEKAGQAGNERDGLPFEQLLGKLV